MSDAIFSKLDFAALARDRTRGTRTRLRIADQAIHLLATRGIGTFSYELLSRKSGVSRALIYRYFPSVNSLLAFLAGYIRHRYQEFVIEQMKPYQKPAELLESYVRSAIRWPDLYRDDFAVWMIFFHHCVASRALAENNQALVDQGTRRIEGILQEGTRAREFKLAPARIPAVARTIQHLVGGGVIARATEARDRNHLEAELEQVWRACQALTGSESRRA